MTVKIHCSNCHKKYPIEQVIREYEYRDDEWFRVTSCHWCGNFISEVQVTK